MTTYFSTFSDPTINLSELKNRISISIEEDIPDEIVSHLGSMLMGNCFSFQKMGVFRDVNTDNFYGILFTSTNSNQHQAKMIISVAMLDERLRQKDVLENLFQNLINDFCNQHPNKETYVQWDESTHICNYSPYVTKEASSLAALLSI